MADLLTVTGLTIVRGGRALVQDLDLSLTRGAVTALTGPNGSGKSTTAWCLSLHDRDCTGEIAFEGVSAADMSPRSVRALHRRTIALQPQHLLLEDSWSVARNLRHAAWSLALPWRQRSDLVSEVMARTAVEGLARRRVDSLSGGERMRVALARTRLMLRATARPPSMPPHQASRRASTPSSSAQDRSMTLPVTTTATVRSKAPAAASRRARSSSVR